MRPQLVIFDCDGVLVDSEVASNQVIADSLARYGLSLSLADCMKHFVGGTMAGVGDKARKMGATLPDGWIDEIHEQIHARLQQGVPAVKGIPELLGTLDTAGIPTCVASNGSEAKMRITLGQNGIWNRFQDRVFSAHRLGVAKPDPDLFLAAAAHFDQRPQNCVVIEDSVSGATAAARAGMRCLGYAPGHDGARMAELGAQVFGDMADVPRLLCL